MNAAIKLAKERTQSSPVAKFFDPEHETFIAAMKPKNDDDPLYDDPDYSPAQIKDLNIASSKELERFPYDPKYVAAVGQSILNYVQGGIPRAQVEFDLIGDDHEKGCTPEEISLITEALSKIPWVQVHTSTGGGGLHVYVPLTKPIPATSRALIKPVNIRVLELMDREHDLPFKLADKVDQVALGRAIFWMWSHRMTEKSFQCLSKATETLNLGDWQPPTTPSVNGTKGVIRFDLKGFLDRNNIRYTEKKSDSPYVDDGVIYLIECPFSQHGDNETRTCVFLSGGVPRFKCYSNKKCSGCTFKKFAKEVAPSDSEAQLTAATTAVLQAMYWSTVLDELFHDQNGDCYVVVDGHSVRVDSEAYKQIVRLRYREKSGQSISETHLNQAIAELVAFARLRCPEHRTYLRVATNGDMYYLDLCNDRVVEIDANGWRVIDAPKDVRFLRPKKFLALPEPERGGDPNLLWEYVPVDDSNKPLILAWLLCALRSDIACAVLVLLGLAGTGKTTRGRFLGSLVNPVSGEDGGDFCLSTEPKKVDDLFAIARNTWVAAIDNLSSLSKEFSDALCCIVTGTAYEGRKLFTNNEESRVTLRRPMLLTSVGNVVTESDLADRCYAVEIPQLATRRPESELWESFLADRPKILGCLLDAFVAGLNNQQPVDGVRLLDGAMFAQAAEEAFYFQRGETVAAIKESQKRMSQTNVEESPLAVAIREAVVDGPVEGTAKALMEHLGDGTETPRRFANQLASVATDLEKTGISVSSRMLGGSKVWKFVNGVA